MPHGTMLYSASRQAYFEKVAVVSASKWVEWGVRLASHLIEGEAKTFSEDQLEETLDWIKT